MSTAELFLEPDEIKDFVKETLADDMLYRVGDEGREIGICPFISFYIYNTSGQFLSIADQVVALFRELEDRIIDEPFRLIWRDDTQDWLPAGDRRLPTDLRPSILAAQRNAQDFWIMATDRDSDAATARWSFAGIVNDGIGADYTRLKITFRERWYRRNPSTWHAFVIRCLQRLQPDHCYSGFEVGNGGFNILGAYECDVLERICADHFYGMDIDHPARMRFHNFNRTSDYVNHVALGAGIRTPTWCFMLSPYWQARLGKTEAQIRAELDDPRIEITSIPYEPNAIYPQGGNGLWIRLGELDLHPVDKGLPELLVKANRLIRPIRCDHLQLLTLDPWDDDPNPRFDHDSSLRWMRRFDDDSDWPDAQRRPPAGGSGDESAPDERLKALPGEAVSREGVWWTPAIAGEAGRVTLAVGERLPTLERTGYGAVVWYWEGEAPR
ncbi:type VI immunity family protein [Aquabacterium humicola]|uniref:type VI immunity family protein n=1 Tax=Aquabacterium humicola TaxID=3237377 RepID=UPI002542863A|nr:type VI immunity family protein [Rubrivivax pictus]